MNYKSLLIITYGRSGSTLLQGLLNDIDGVLIRGENFNFCFDLFQSYQSLMETQKQAKKSIGEVSSPTESWFGGEAYDMKEYVNGQAAIVKQLLIGKNKEVDCYGFKEVRYSRIIGDEFYEYLNFLTKIFPNVCILFNTRNLDDVLISGWWKKREQKEARQLLIDTEARFKEYSLQHNNCFIINYADVVEQTKVLEKFYAFIGVEYDQARINSVLSKPHGYGQSSRVMKKMKAKSKGTRND